MRISDWSSDVCSSDLTPLGALIMGAVLAECDILPEGPLSILPATRAGADLFTTDERLKLLSFTRSPGVRWARKAKAGKKKVELARSEERRGGEEGVCKCRAGRSG